MSNGTSKRAAGKQSAAAEAYERFDRWYRQDGHWIYSTRDKALDTWKRVGIEGLPRYRGEVA